MWAPGGAEGALVWKEDVITRAIAGIPHFIVLCFIVFCRYCVFYRLKVCGNPAISTIFLTGSYDG